MYLPAPVLDNRRYPLWQQAKDPGSQPIHVHLLVTTSVDASLPQDDRRQWARFLLDDVNAMLFVRDLGRVPAGLLTLSAGGARFRTYTDLPSGTPMCVQIYNPVDQCSEFVDLRVVHSQRRPDGIYVAGGLFPIPLGDRLFHALVGAPHTW